MLKRVNVDSWLHPADAMIDVSGTRRAKAPDVEAALVLLALKVLVSIQAKCKVDMIQSV